MLSARYEGDCSEPLGLEHLPCVVRSRVKLGLLLMGAASVIARCAAEPPADRVVAGAAIPARGLRANTVERVAREAAELGEPATEDHVGEDD